MLKRLKEKLTSDKEDASGYKPVAADEKDKTTKRNPSSASAAYEKKASAQNTAKPLSPEEKYRKKKAALDQISTQSTTPYKTDDAYIEAQWKPLIEVAKYDPSPDEVRRALWRGIEEDSATKSLLFRLEHEPSCESTTLVKALKEERTKKDASPNKSKPNLFNKPLPTQARIEDANFDLLTGNGQTVAVQQPDLLTGSNTGTVTNFSPDIFTGLTFK